MVKWKKKDALSLCEARRTEDWVNLHERVNTLKSFRKRHNPLSIIPGWFLWLPTHPSWACEVTQSCPTRCDPMDSSLHQAPPSIRFSRQEYWSGLPFPSPGNLLNPGIEPRSPTLQADTTVWATREAPILFKMRLFHGSSSWVRSFGWTPIQNDWCPYKKINIGLICTEGRWCEDAQEGWRKTELEQYIHKAKNAQDCLPFIRSQEEAKKDSPHRFQRKWGPANS